MTHLRRIAMGLALLATTAFQAAGQLASLEPRSMEAIDAPANGNKMLAFVEIVFSQPVEGVRISTDNFAATDKTRQPTATTVFARVIADSPASRGAYGKSITVTHPDYLPCVLDFSGLGLSESVKPGMQYRINVDVPAADLVRAHRAFADLDYSLAREYYNRYIGGGGEMSALAHQRLAVMDKLQEHRDYLDRNSSSTDRTTRIRMMKCAKDIYDLTSSMEAYRRYQTLRGQLVKKSVGADIDGASSVTVDSVWHDERDMRAKSDTSLPLVNGNAHYSWILVNAGLDNMTFEADGLFSAPEMVNGAYLLKVCPGQEGPSTIVAHHPDCTPVTIDLARHGVSEIRPASVYNVNLTPPPATVIEADRAFSNLDFSSAHALYADILSNSDQYPAGVVSMVSRRMQDVSRLLDRDFRTTWRRLRDFFVKRPTASREELASRADSLADMSRELHLLQVPGMDNNAEHYARRAREYRNSIFLSFSITEVNNRKEILVGDDGNPKPLEAKTLLVSFKVPGHSYDYPVKASATRPGEFAVYLPDRVSDWLTSNVGKEIEVKLHDPSTRKRYEIQAGRKSGFRLALDSGSDRSVTANIYSKSLALSKQ